MISKVRRPAAGRLMTVWREQQARRFAGCFPRVYAFTLAMTDDETASRDLATAAFAETFTLGEMTEQEFVVELFRQARELARRAPGTTHRGLLNAREREIISLTFDAKLSREQISLVLGVTADGVAAALLKGLRKLEAARLTAPERLVPIVR